jgi:hypothetical protein
MCFLKLKDSEKKTFLKNFVFKNLIGKKISNIIIPNKHYCSRFAVISAKTIFDWKKEYREVSGNAWDLKYNSNYKLVYSFKENKPFNIELLNPGMFVLLYNNLSAYNNKKDIYNKKIEYTHVILYLGIIDKKPFFIQMYNDYSELIDFETLFSKSGRYSENKFEIKEVLEYVGY